MHRILIILGIVLLVVGLAASFILLTSQSDFEKGHQAYQAEDYQTAAKWYRQAATQGDADAQYNLAAILATGAFPRYNRRESVAKNANEAVKWYRQAAEQGHAKAQYALGAMYITGEGVIKNYKTAMKWYRQAAEQGYAKAQYSLGVIYGKGERVAKNDKTAVKWYRQAAEQGYARAQFLLGAAYFNGRGVVQNQQKAYMWYLLAKANRHDGKSVAAAIRELEKVLPLTAQEAAQQEASEWQAKFDARTEN